ncbi:putative secreted lipase [Colletotrichum orbiculare MAFF 240422]|uniref:Secreted lipase n=1 Tax=Colletotrichum orbiculare (strain 104-T / ATCC 96160 / CBS 514.97 / LARS 414 / MAFF 240422) TaxID=1213857 RepID=N4UZI6_COLOR|nr:putative secreted lipase [Colletotrichum orbiculare MAFF 240422]
MVKLNVVSAGLLAGASLSFEFGGRDCTGVNAIHPRCRNADSIPYTRDFFYVGGRALETASGELTADKLYVEKISPILPLRSKPVVFFHGGGCSGTSWLNTPDNRKGFANYFVQQGYVVYILDAAGNGRSANADLEGFPLTAGSSATLVEMGFSAPEAYNGYPQSRLHTQFPGTGRAGDPVFENFKNSMVPYTTNNITFENAMRSGGCKLLSLIGKSYVVGHSAGGSAGILLSNDCPELVAANINLESSTIPFFWYTYGTAGIFNNAWGLANTPLNYTPPISDASELKRVEVGNSTVAKRSCFRQAEPVHTLPNIASVPYLMITGEASVHVTYDHCIVDYMKQIGAQPEWIKLADRGIHGNGQFMHLEKNNGEIAKLVLDWIRRKEGTLW